MMLGYFDKKTLISSKCELSKVDIDIPVSIRVCLYQVHRSPAAPRGS